MLARHDGFGRFGYMAGLLLLRRPRAAPDGGLLPLSGCSKPDQPEAHQERGEGLGVTVKDTRA
jgi:hypothetical protein